MALDEKFHISLADEAAEGVVTVADVFEVVSCLIGMAQPKT